MDSLNGGLFADTSVSRPCIWRQELLLELIRRERSEGEVGLEEGGGGGGGGE